MVEATLLLTSSASFFMSASSAEQSAFDTSRFLSPLLTSFTPARNSAMSDALTRSSLLCASDLLTCKQTFDDPRAQGHVHTSKQRIR